MSTDLKSFVFVKVVIIEGLERRSVVWHSLIFILCLVSFSLALAPQGDRARIFGFGSVGSSIKLNQSLQVSAEASVHMAAKPTIQGKRLQEDPSRWYFFRTRSIHMSFQTDKRPLQRTVFHWWLVWNLSATVYVPDSRSILAFSHVFFHVFIKETNSSFICSSSSFLAGLPLLYLQNEYQTSQVLSWHKDWS